ncbi:uncharacterized protein LOC119098995 [Pollicipes pollicipes]|uniref:uncharacterized protein LOC119098995 n=1 Tax=Pollicipes pollicipes TaxID=41117 RepID=UPI001884CC68|nr:uncharacterized protein LOC119098995 [Pollicipes pollicipes]
MRQHVRTRLGLILNEIGLLHNRRLENLMQTVDGGGADGLRARAEAQRRPMERAYKSAEAAFSKAVTLLDGTPQRCATEMNLGHLYDRSAAAQHRLPPASEKRRTQLLGEALETYSQAATMYQEAGRPDRLLAMLHAQATVREGCDITMHYRPLPLCLSICARRCRSDPASIRWPGL